MYKGIDEKYVKEVNKLKRKKMSKFQAFNKYILTWKVKLVLACFAGLTAAFYFFADLNVAVSMFFALAITLIIIAIIFPQEDEDEDEANEALDYLLFFAPTSPVERKEKEKW
ncbi:MAG: hypothetical protein QMC83_09010 [Thermodesulfovibrionales bacterium]|nr:hypothetical protein [Thermodesulfovibrionales bacterium]